MKILKAGEERRRSGTHICLGELSRGRFYLQSRKQPSGRRRPRTPTIIAKGICFSSIDFTSLLITSNKSSYLEGLSMSYYYDILLDSPRKLLTCWRKTLSTLAQSVLLGLVSLGHLWPGQCVDYTSSSLSVCIETARISYNQL